MFLCGFSSESEGGKGVHDEVNPEDLDRGQDLLVEEKGTQKHDENSDDVNGKLELEELLDGVIDVTSELYADKSCVEVVSDEDNLCFVLSSI